MTKQHDHDETRSTSPQYDHAHRAQEARNEATTQDHAQDAARESTQAESARVAAIQPNDSRPADGGAPVEPHTEHFPHQPHGQAGQPQARPAHEGHQGVTPIQPEGQGLEEGFSPTEAITHGEPHRVVDTEYTGVEGVEPPKSHREHADKEKSGGHDADRKAAGEAAGKSPEDKHLHHGKAPEHRSQR